MNTNILLQSVIISRNIIRNYARRIKVANPGIQKQLNISDDKNLENFDIEDIESDFMNVGEVHKEHEKELKQFHEKEKFWIVKQRYFKENKINFLTWNDKEQIQFLHQSDPEEWTVERLAESFPAFPDTIKKIVKSKWQPKSDDKKLHHDKAVERNWKLLREGKLSEVLPSDLLNHISKFSSRTQVQISKSGEKIVSNPKFSEFSSIISDFETKKKNINVPVNEQINEYCEKTNKIDETLKGFGRKPVTMSVVRNDEDKMEDDRVLDFELKLPEKYKNETKAIQFGPKDDKNIVMYPERIKIPKDKFKKGYTYKLNDCYYDDDGEFLYRVPGMY